MFLPLTGKCQALCSSTLRFELSEFLNLTDKNNCCFFSHMQLLKAKFWRLIDHRDTVEGGRKQERLQNLVNSLFHREGCSSIKIHNKYLIKKLVK